MYKNMERKEIKYPAAWCSRICRNSMNETCVEHCTVKRDCSSFIPKPHIELEDMALFPLKEWSGMTKGEKGTSIAIYVSKIVEHLKGGENGTDIHYPRSLTLFENFKIKSLQHGSARIDTTCEDRKECSNTGK